MLGVLLLFFFQSAEYLNANFFCCHFVDWLIFKTLKNTHRLTHNLRPHIKLHFRNEQYILSNWHKDQTTKTKQKFTSLRTYWFYFITSDSQHHNGHKYGNCQKITASHYAERIFVLAWLLFFSLWFYSFVYKFKIAVKCVELTHSFSRARTADELNSHTVDFHTDTWNSLKALCCDMRRTTTKEMHSTSDFIMYILTEKFLRSNFFF